MVKYLFAILLLSFALLSATAVQPSGSGAEADPYQIESLDNLQWVYENENMWDRWYIQTDDIDASATSFWNNGAGWMPLGYRNSSIDHEYFDGSYDGQGHSISGLTINRPAGNNQGFFGYASQATISNLVLLDVNIHAYNTVGALIGNFLNGTVSNCCATGSVAGNNVVGGLIGDKRGETSCCYSACAVTGSSNVGGFAGSNSSMLYDCYTTGSVSGTSNVGGLVGGNFPGGDIQKSYSVGSVIGDTNTGGLVGYNNATVATSFWNTQTSGQSSSAGGTGKNTALMKTATTYTEAGWDFVGETANGSNDYWSIDGGNNTGYPYLSWQGYLAYISANPASLDLGTRYCNGSAISADLTISNSGEEYLAISALSFATGGQGFSTTAVTLPYTIAPGGSLTITVTFNNNTLGDYNDTLVITSNALDNPTLEIPVSAITRYNIGDTGMLGIGTEASPLQVADFEDLLWITNHSSLMSAWFIQTDNIDASPSTDLNNGCGWSPISTFTGNYDGQGYIISNLYINRPDSNDQGLFGYAASATIKNLGVTNADIAGNQRVGGLVGMTDTFDIFNITNTEIRNCFSTGQVSGNSQAGGLVGTGSYATISNCYTTSSANSTMYSGGLVGSIFSSNISKCYSTGNVGGMLYSGGLIGQNDGSTVSNSFWNTQTSGQSSSSGGTGKTTAEMMTQSTFTDAGWDFAGETVNGTQDTWSINSAVNNGFPYLTWQPLAPIISYMPLAIELDTCYYGQVAAIKSVTVFNDGLADLTISDVSYMNSGQGFTLSCPTLPHVVAPAGYCTITVGFQNSTAGEYSDILLIDSDASQVAVPVSIFNTDDLGDTGMEGDGSEDAPLQIAELDDLLWISENPICWGVWFVQVADIDASSTSTWNSNTGWIPLGNSSQKFTGHYNGQGYTISGLRVNRSSSDYQAFFGYTDGAAISNILLTGAVVHADNFGACLVGNNDNSTITNCSCQGSINGSQCGGLVAVNTNSSIFGCRSAGSITSSPFSLYNGGLVSMNTYSSITNSYSWCSVCGSLSGGLIGSDSHSTTTNCYSKGSVSGLYSGGMIAECDSSNVINSFWDTQTSGKSSSAGGTGKTTAEMKTQFTFTDAGWDFMDETANGAEDIWVIDGYNNSGYPYLSWQDALPVIDVSSVQLDFGTVSISTESSLTITIRNESHVSLEISQMTFADGSQGFGVEQGTPVSLAAHDSLMVDITFAPETTGTFIDTLHIVSDACNAETVSIALSGMGIVSEPSAPENVTIQLQDNDVILSWDPVTTNINGAPITSDGYNVLYSETPDASAEDYLLLGFVTGTTCTHSQVLLSNNRLFYIVRAVIGEGSVRPGHW